MAQNKSSLRTTILLVIIIHQYSVNTCAVTVEKPLIVNEAQEVYI